MKKICCIISAGDVNLPLLKKKKNEYDYFIAADLGYFKAKQADIIPQMAVGDFDSLGNYSAKDTISTTFVPFSSDKDFTDTYLALEEGIKLGYTHFHVYGALGGDRFSHSIANLQTISQMKTKGIHVSLMGEKELVYPVKNETLSLKMQPGTTFSVFSLTEQATGVTITGAKYPLKDAVLTLNFPIGVSNLSIENVVTISAKEGILLVIEEF